LTGNATSARAIVAVIPERSFIAVWASTTTTTTMNDFLQSRIASLVEHLLDFEFLHRWPESHF
jgi:hypothetical protein